MGGGTGTMLRAWEFAPGAGVPLALLAAAYLAGLWLAARRRPGGPWTGGRDRARTAAFLGGLAAAAVATQGPPAVYDDVSLRAHMVQHLLLIMVAPPLLVYGRPVTLALHVTRNPWHTRIKRVLRSRAVAAATWPGTALIVYSAVVMGTHLTGLLTARGALHDAEHAAYLAAGYLYFLPVIGSEPLRWRVPPLGRYLLLLAAMPADVVTGGVLMLRGGTGGYSAADVHGGGLIMLAGTELIMVSLALAFAVALVREAEPAAGQTLARHIVHRPDEQMTQTGLCNDFGPGPALSPIRTQLSVRTQPAPITQRDHSAPTIAGTARTAAGLALLTSVY